MLAAGRIWVTNELAGTVQSLGRGGRTLQAGLQPGGLAAAANRVAVADVRGNRLYIFDAVSERRIAELARRGRADARGADRPYDDRGG